MPTPMRPWTVQLYAFIDAGVHDREELIRLLMPFVPIGHAHRRRERDRSQFEKQSRKAGIPEGHRKEVTLADVHRIGARRVIVDALKSGVANGRLIREGDRYRRPYMTETERLDEAL